jgi:hypothetical protein
MTATFVLVEVLQQLSRTYRATLSTFEAHIGHNLPRWRNLFNFHERDEPCPLIDALSQL